MRGYFCGYLVFLFQLPKPLLGRYASLGDALLIRRTLSTARFATPPASPSAPTNDLSEQLQITNRILLCVENMLKYGNRGVLLFFGWKIF